MALKSNKSPSQSSQEPSKIVPIKHNETILQTPTLLGRLGGLCQHAIKFTTCWAMTLAISKVQNIILPMDPVPPHSVAERWSTLPPLCLHMITSPLLQHSSFLISREGATRRLPRKSPILITTAFFFLKLSTVKNFPDASNQKKCYEGALVLQIFFQGSMWAILEEE